MNRLLVISGPIAAGKSTVASCSSGDVPREWARGRGSRLGPLYMMLDRPPMSDPHAALVKHIDCLQIPVPDMEAGLAFYRDAPGHALIWRTPTAAGLQMADSASEIVLQTERPELE
jgi:hypothetical protein